MKDIYIVGAGGFAREVAWLIEDINENKNTWNIKGYIDENVENIGRELNGYKVLGDIAYLNNQSKANVVIAIGTGNIREKIVKKIKNHNYPILIHPSVVKSKYLEIGEGTIICAQSLLTINIKLGKFNVISINSKISHDIVQKDYVTLLPNTTISGNVTIEKNVIIGAGSIVIQGIEIGENTIIGAGAVVNKNIQDNVTAVGVPIKIIKIKGKVE